MSYWKADHLKLEKTQETVSVGIAREACADISLMNNLRDLQWLKPCLPPPKTCTPTLYATSLFHQGVCRGLCPLFSLAQRYFQLQEFGLPHILKPTFTCFPVGQHTLSLMQKSTFISAPLERENTQTKKYSDID